MKLKNTATLLVHTLFLLLIFSCRIKTEDHVLPQGTIKVIDSVFIHSDQAVRFINYDLQRNIGLFGERSPSNVLITYDFNSGTQDTFLVCSSEPEFAETSVLTANIINGDSLILTDKGLFSYSKKGIIRYSKGVVAQNLPTNTFLDKIVIGNDSALIVAHMPYNMHLEPNFFGILTFSDGLFEGFGVPPMDLKLPVDGHLLADFNQSCNRLYFAFNPLNDGYFIDFASFQSIEEVKKNNQNSYKVKQISFDHFQHPYYRNEKYGMGDFPVVSQIYDLFSEGQFTIIHYSDPDLTLDQDSRIYRHYLSVFDQHWNKLSADLLLPENNYKIEALLGDGVFLAKVSSRIEYPDRTRFDLLEISIPGLSR